MKSLLFFLGKNRVAVSTDWKATTQWSSGVSPSAPCIPSHWQVLATGSTPTSHLKPTCGSLCLSTAPLVKTPSAPARGIRRASQPVPRVVPLRSRSWNTTYSWLPSWNKGFPSFIVESRSAAFTGAGGSRDSRVPAAVRAVAVAHRLPSQDGTRALGQQRWQEAVFPASVQ